MTEAGRVHPTGFFCPRAALAPRFFPHLLPELYMPIQYQGSRRLGIGIGRRLTHMP